MKLNLIRNIGPKTEKLLNKLNIYEGEDLLKYYPYRYNFINIITIDKASADLNYVTAFITSNIKVQYIKKNLNYLNFMAKSNNTIFKVVIFNRAFLKNNLTLNRKIVLVGKYDKLKNTFLANDIKFNIFQNTVEAIYHLTKGLKNNMFSKFIQEVLNNLDNVVDYIPNYLNEKYKLISKNSALEFIHFPKNQEEIKKARLKLIYEELFIYMFKINYLKNLNQRTIGIKREIDYSYIENFISELPFKLTEDQLKALKDIYEDMTSPKRMNRLLLGDVGSGKTIVAIIAILINYLAGYQSSFMAPTEILANQHYEVLINYFKDMGINICLLTGSLTKSQKEKMYQDIKNKKIDVVIGTHALLNEKLEFNNLGLVITDEQHRFGVNQRSILQNKGIKAIADVLYLSATPIPRTYALTIYGDLDISLIKTKPQKRGKVFTQIKTEKDIKEVLQKMLDEIKLGHQVFVVSPAIDEDEQNSLNSVIKLKEKLDIAFKNKVNIAIIHGKLKPKEKDEIMHEFQKKKIAILISTTVIEVGIDIPNASTMVIFNAERFGLATLHQLRGRIGRGNLDAYCYLISSDNTNARLKVMEESNDGFYISEKDFELRGPGDLFGIRQSGDMTFKIADLKRDFKILNQANIDVRNFIKEKQYNGNNIYKEIIKNINFLD